MLFFSEKRAKKYSRPDDCFTRSSRFVPLCVDVAVAYCASSETISLFVRCRGEIESKFSLLFQVRVFLFEAMGLLLRVVFCISSGTFGVASN